MVSVRIAVLLCAVAASVGWVLVWRKCNVKRRAQAILVLTWTVHTLIFTVAAQCQWFTPAVLNLWSSITRTHGLLAALFLAVDLLTDGGCGDA